ncbi:MAG: hypothetical protein ACD_64C00062G0005 [uncultured bacterium]|nr:MAG: hypothetical protein ACD_64C00062G0005 [uncultured bacterium]HLE76559.1 outer membrane protein assembly factor BamD [Candidatus Babeliales bacterium]
MNTARTLLLIFTSATFGLQAAPSIGKQRTDNVSAEDKTAQDIKKMKQQREKEAKIVRTGKRRKGLTQNKIIHTFSTMTFDELKVAKDSNKARKHFDVVEKYLERMIALAENVNERADLIMELADTHFSQGEYTAAKKQYEEFERLYPGNIHIERAKRHIIICAQQTILTPDRDQSPTEETLRLAIDYLDRETFTTYRNEIETIKKECETMLAQSECNITNFYIKQKNFESAKRRISHIRTAYLEKVPEVATTLAQLEVDLGMEWKEFQVPEESIKLAQATPVKTSDKTDMTARF